MASIGYAKPHYRILSQQEAQQYMLWVLYSEPFLTSFLGDIYGVIRDIHRAMGLSVVHFNNRYWVVTYP